MLDRAYEPDKIFGIESASGLRYYFLEGDRDSEPFKRGARKTLAQVAASKDPFGSSSLFRKLVQQRHAIPAARAQLGRPVMALYVFNSRTQFEGFIELCKEFKVNNTILAKYTPEFPKDDHIVKPPIEDILTGWTMCKDGSRFDLIVN